MKIFAHAILSAVMFASMPVFAATGILLKKDAVFANNDYFTRIAEYGTTKEGFNKCWVGIYRYGNAVPNNVVPAGTVFPIANKENKKVFADIDGVGQLWQIKSTVYAPLGTSPDSFYLTVVCSDAYHLFMSFPDADEAISSFPDYIEEVEL